MAQPNRQPCLRPNVQLAAKPAPDGYTLRDEGDMAVGLRSTRSQPLLFRGVRPVRRLRPAVWRVAALPEDRRGAGSVRLPGIRRDPDLSLFRRWPPVPDGHLRVAQDEGH